MDDFPWAALFTLVGTLSAVWLANIFTSRSDERRIKAEATQDALLAEREAAAAKAAVQSREAADAENVAAGIRDLFLDELRKVRLMGDLEARDFDERFEKAFDIDGDIKLRRAIGAVRDNEQRAQLTVVVDTLSRISAVSDHNFRTSGVWAESAITIGANLAATFARRQELESSLLANFNELHGDLTGYLDYQQAKAKKDMDAAQKRFKELSAGLKLKEAASEPQT